MATGKKIYLPRETLVKELVTRDDIATLVRELDCSTTTIENRLYEAGYRQETRFVRLEPGATRTILKRAIRATDALLTNSPDIIVQSDIDKVAQAFGVTTRLITEELYRRDYGKERNFRKVLYD